MNPDPKTESPGLLSALFEHIRMGVLVEDRDLRIRYVNSEFRRLFGISDASALLGLDGAMAIRSAKDLFADPAAFLSRLDELRASGGSVEAEELRLADGRVLERDAIPLVSEFLPSGTLWLYRDVTERRKALDSIHQAETQMRSAIDSMSDAMHLVDRNLRVLFFNRAFKSWTRELGLDPEAVGRTLAEVFPFLPDSVFEEYRSVFESGEVMVTEDANRIGNGLIHTETRKIPVLENGRVERIITVVRNVTERNRAEEALRLSGERLTLAMEASNDGLFDWDMETGRAYFSPRYYTMLGYEPGAFEGSLDALQTIVHPEDRDRLLGTVAEYSDAGRENHDIEFRLRVKTGEWKWIRSRGKMVSRRPDGKPLRMAGTHTDVTDRKRAEQEAARALREKEVLLKEVHHRVKNNLTIISGLLNLQSASVTGKAQAVRAFRECRDRVHSIALVHTRLYEANDFSRIRFGGYLKALVEELLKSYDFHRSIAVTYAVEDAVLDITTAVPCGLILNELVTNALKHAFKGRSSGKLKIGFRRRKDGKFALSVADNGAGMPEAVASGKTDSFGMQLIGMLSEQVGGRVRITRTKGTSVILTIPAPPSSLNGWNPGGRAGAQELPPRP